jgi:hypothetical protein
MGVLGLWQLGLLLQVAGRLLAGAQAAVMPPGSSSLAFSRDLGPNAPRSQYYVRRHCLPRPSLKSRECAISESDDTPLFC